MSSVTFHGSRGVLSADEEARELALSAVEEKRTFFAEDMVDLNYTFHFGLLSPSCHCEPPFGEAIPKLMRRLLRGATAPLAMTSLKQNPFIHIRDEGLLRGTTPNYVSFVVQ